ncbi:MAG: ligand-binding sensor domain-containing protein, partial [Myxococcota bacterium]
DIWVGYEGFRQLSAVGDILYPSPDTPDPAPLVAVTEGEEVVVEPSQAEKLQRDLLQLKVYDAELTGASRWLATENFGLVLFADDDVNQVEGYPKEDTYGVTVNAQGVWVAGSGAGLVGPRGITLGRADGLPSGTVWSVAGVGSGLWVGTNRGLAWVMFDEYGGVRSIVPRPYSHWPADRHARDLVATPDGAFVAGKAGVWSIGAPHPHAENLVAAVDGPVVALLELDGTLWSVGESLLGLDRDGHLSRVDLPQPAVTAVVWNEMLWIADGRVLWRVDPERGRLVRVSELVGVTRLTSNKQAIWAVTEQGRLARVLLGASRPISGVDLVIDAQPGEDGTVCLGTEDGLVRLMEDSGQTQDVLGARDRNVRVPAVAVDSAGGCWFAAEDGTVGRALLDGRENYTHLPPKSTGEPLRIVPDGEDAAWILTSRGTWRVRLPL